MKSGLPEVLVLMLVAFVFFMAGVFHGSDIVMGAIASDDGVEVCRQALGLPL